MSGYKRVNFYELCRLCAQSIQKEKTHIFGEDGRKIQLQSKIKNCLSIIVNEDDFLPKVVCSKCIRQLQVCSSFREECVSSETMLSSYFKNFRQTEDFKKSGKVYIKDTVATSEVSSTNVNLATVPAQNVVNLKPGALEGQFYAVQLPNVAAKSKTDKRPAQFPNAQQQMAYNMNLLNAAIKSTVQQLPKELLSNVLVNSNGEVINITQPCDLDSSYTTKPKKCDKTKKIVKELEVADENVVKIDLTSEGELFGEKRDTLPHIKSTSQPQNPSKYQTSPTPTVIFPLSEFQNGFASYQYSQPISNNNLTNVVCNASELDNTAQLNPNTQDFNVTSTYASLSNVVHQTQPLPQPVSNGEIKNEQPNAKQEATDVVKPHTCDICFKSFKRREHLYQHIKLHTGFRPYKCTQCSKSFMRKEHLLRHMTLHSGIRNYECDVCNKCFSRNDNLLKHKKTHDKQSSYTCEVCRKVFVMKHYYQAHKNTHGKCFAPTTGIGYVECKI